ncbi:10887_t:CDS:2 [Entrophospora sp. SA101]|nr:10887_t:CDS:2 [Entrophospora sp. SA101]
MLLIISKNNLNTALARKPVIHEFPNINLPFPPVIKAKDFIDPETNSANTSSTNHEAATVNTNTTAIYKNSKKKINKLTTKAPNKFFIYRKAWVMELRERGFQYPMTEISGFIAKKWQEETPERKNAYVKIAMEAKTLHKQKFGDKIKYNNNNDFTSASSQPKKTIKKKSKFSQFKQPMVSLHNHTTIPSSSLILPTPGTTPTLPTPIASPILPPSSSYIDDNYFNEFINIDNNTTITSNNNNEENLPCVCDSPSTVHSSSENGDLEEIDPDLFTFLI